MLEKKWWKKYTFAVEISTFFTKKEEEGWDQSYESYVTWVVGLKRVEQWIYFKQLPHYIESRVP